jgi:uncharacterized membrane protein YgcG
MRKMAIMFGASLLALTASVAASCAGPANDPPGSCQERSRARGARHSAKAQIAALMKKNPNGGRRLAAAIEHILTQRPCACADVVEAAALANHEQALALGQGVVQAEALVKSNDPAGAQQIQSYLDANGSNPDVASILRAEGSQGSQTPSGQASQGSFREGGGNSGGAGGVGGGGFVGGGGGVISRH